MQTKQNKNFQDRSRYSWSKIFFVFGVLVVNGGLLLKFRRHTYKFNQVSTCSNLFFRIAEEARDRRFKIFKESFNMGTHHFFSKPEPEKNAFFRTYILFANKGDRKNRITKQTKVNKSKLLL